MLRNINVYSTSASFRLDENKFGPLTGSFSSQPETMLIEQGKLRLHIPVQNIRYVKSEHVYCRIFFPNNHQILQRISLDKLLTKLPEDSFMRVHRSYLINVNHVRKFTSRKILIEKTVIPVGRTWRDRVVLRLNELNQK